MTNSELMLYLMEKDGKPFFYYQEQGKSAHSHPS